MKDGLAPETSFLGRAARAVEDSMDIMDGVNIIAAETYAFAALKAIREPSDGLMNAFRCASREEWQAAIDHILAEGI